MLGHYSGEVNLGLFAAVASSPVGDVVIVECRQDVDDGQQHGSDDAEFHRRGPTSTTAAASHHRRRNTRHPSSSSSLSVAATVRNIGSLIGSRSFVLYETIRQRRVTASRRRKRKLRGANTSPPRLAALNASVPKRRQEVDNCFG